MAVLSQTDPVPLESPPVFEVAFLGRLSDRMMSRTITRTGFLMVLFLAFLPIPGTAARGVAPRLEHWVTDEIGRRVEIADHLSRVVSLAPNTTETLYALGLGDLIVGDTD